ncbi:MAG TPA: transposase [Polyangiaceae bacterium]|nr:transposase [Polyangiaceae bacterium]
MALYARGMTTRDIQQHLRELYGTDVSPDLISRATEGVMDEFRAWQSRPLEAV